MQITSSAFENMGRIPTKYGRLHENINPPLTISNIPEDAKSLALVMDDPDVPEMAGVTVWDHWVVYNISPHTKEIPENWDMSGCTQGVGTRGEDVYGGPKPPDREHRYFFKIYALDSELDLAPGATKSELEVAMEGHVIERAELIGLYSPEQDEDKS